MTVTTRKSNADAHPGAPDLPTTTRRSSQEVTRQKRAAKRAEEHETRMAIEQVFALGYLEEEMAEQDAIERRNASRPISEANTSGQSYFIE
jgi:hypothetical protein